jgi:hypothetical protein
MRSKLMTKKLAFPIAIFGFLYCLPLRAQRMELAPPAFASISGMAAPILWMSLSKPVAALTPASNFGLASPGKQL